MYMSVSKIPWKVCVSFACIVGRGRPNRLSRSNWFLEVFEVAESRFWSQGQFFLDQWALTFRPLKVEIHFALYHWNRAPSVTSGRGWLLCNVGELKSKSIKWLKAGEFVFAPPSKGTGQSARVWRQLYETALNKLQRYDMTVCGSCWGVDIKDFKRSY